MDQKQLAREAVNRAASHLHSYGIRVADFTLTTEWDWWRPVGGSSVWPSTRHFNMGRYPTEFSRNWFAMHELGHLLWAEHQPLRSHTFRSAFGEPLPPDYERIYKLEAWKAFLFRRPDGEPSYYGARGGGEERFCEMIGLMWATGGFSDPPPADLATLWDCCWAHGLARMT